MEEDAPEDATSIGLAIERLTNRAKTLLLELETFRNHLRRIRQEQDVELAHFRGAVQSEVGMLERLSKKLDDVNTGHVARSSNVPFLESVWDNAKKSHKLKSVQKVLYFNSPSKSLSQAMRHVRIRSGNEAKNAKVTVDIISDGGLTWTKFSSITNNRLIFDLAKLGWQSEEDSESEDGGNTDEDDDDDDVPLVKMVKELCQAARSYRTRTKMPVVHLLLPRIKLGETKQIDSILDKCRRAGAIVFTGNDIKPAPALEDALSAMAPDPFSTFSDTLNIDCTILLALVSEFSHARVAKEAWFHKGLQRQVEIEGNENLLPALLYPALGARRLVCTREAAKRMREIVATIGTASEKARTEILLSGDSSKSRGDLSQEMQEWSAYAVPDEWQLPVQIVEEDEDNCMANLSPAAVAVGAKMTLINRSVFVHGWATGRTTITSNRAVVKQIENDLEKFEDLDESVWPSIWLCPTARSLVGKEKEKRSSKKEDWEPRPKTLPDPLTREQQRRNGLDVLSAREGREVEDLRPNGYPCEEVIAAKNAAQLGNSSKNGTGT
ncbi:uncharacterized protein RCC_04687 [Ramularia collo-cygni]|uniref:DUF1308 domain-containing protein n=1 Tax=Ramularia collo-cygni TaxID=112498 RepID=A0A2D3UQ33_9PEZI|nr:uncharacterized protein RCC_04687 [Ramularia collo-cygni]CZT18842.1 uncharacterized protein RCC_04687 [Ramularia collo-cygni]